MPVYLKNRIDPDTLAETLKYRLTKVEMPSNCLVVSDIGRIHAFTGDTVESVPVSR